LLLVLQELPLNKILFLPHTCSLFKTFENLLHVSFHFNKFESPLELVWKFLSVTTAWNVSISPSWCPLPIWSSQNYTILFPTKVYGCIYTSIHAALACYKDISITMHWILRF
jgi:hypothetical protein